MTIIVVDELSLFSNSRSVYSVCSGREGWGMETSTTEEFPGSIKGENGELKEWRVPISRRSTII